MEALIYWSVVFVLSWLLAKVARQNERLKQRTRPRAIRTVHLQWNEHRRRVVDGKLRKKLKVGGPI